MDQISNPTTAAAVPLPLAREAKKNPYFSIIIHYFSVELTLKYKENENEQ